jgi:hypothetical protein
MSELAIAIHREGMLLLLAPVESMLASHVCEALGGCHG